MTYKPRKYIKLFVNGRKVAAVTKSVPSRIPYENLEKFVIGRFSSTGVGYLSGWVDDIHVFNKALDSSEIKDVMINSNIDEDNDGFDNIYEQFVAGTNPSNAEKK